MLATLDTDGAGVASRAQSARVVPNSGTTVLTKGSYQQVNWPAQKLYIGSERYDIASGNSTTANGGSAISNSEWSAIYFKPDSEDNILSLLNDANTYKDKDCNSKPI